MSRRHRIRLLPDGRNMCSAERCGVTGTSAEVTAHIRYRINRAPDGTWIGPGALTAASLADLLTQLGMPASA